jgi:hypothetical protein
MRALFKKYRKLREPDLYIDNDIVDFDKVTDEPNAMLRRISVPSCRDKGSSFEDFSHSDDDDDPDEALTYPAFELTSIPG